MPTQAEIEPTKIPLLIYYKIETRCLKADRLEFESLKIFYILTDCSNQCVRQIRLVHEANKSGTNLIFTYLTQDIATLLITVCN